MWIMIHRSEIGRSGDAASTSRSVGALHDGARHVALQQEPFDVRRGSGRAEVVEVRVGITLEGDRWRRRTAGEDVREPVPLDVGHVPHQTEQGQRRRRHACPHQCGAVERVAFPEQGARAGTRARRSAWTFVTGDRRFRSGHRRVASAQANGASWRNHRAERGPVSWPTCVNGGFPGEPCRSTWPSSCSCRAVRWPPGGRSTGPPTGTSSATCIRSCGPPSGLLGLYFWWMLIHTDYETVGLKGMQRQQAPRPRQEHEATEDAPPTPGVAARRRPRVRRGRPGAGGLQRAPGRARRAGAEDVARPRIRRRPAGAVKRLDPARTARGALPLPADGQHRRRADHPAVPLHRAALCARSAASRPSSPSSASATATSTSST